MAKRGPKAKEKTFEEEVWDNHNPYYKPKEPTHNEMKKRMDDKTLARMQKNIAFMAEKCGFEENKGAVTIISKKVLSAVYYIDNEKKRLAR